MHSGSDPFDQGGSGLFKIIRGESRDAVRGDPFEESGFGRFERPSFYKPVENAECAEWYVAGLQPEGCTVSLYVPAGFEACVRIPHPRWKQVPQHTPGAVFYHGCQVHGCWVRPVAFDSDPHAYGANEGQLIGPWADVLFQALADESSSFDEQCICGLWEGQSGKGPATAQIWNRTDLGFLLYRASRNVIGQQLSTHLVKPDPSNIPNIIWPENRSWCVATPFQFFSTYVAGPQTLIDRLLNRRSEIDVRVAHLDDSLWARIPSQQQQ